MIDGIYVLHQMLLESVFLSPYCLRSVSLLKGLYLPFKRVTKRGLITSKINYQRRLAAYRWGAAYIHLFLEMTLLTVIKIRKANSF